MALFGGRGKEQAKRAPAELPIALGWWATARQGQMDQEEVEAMFGPAVRAEKDTLDQLLYSSSDFQDVAVALGVDATGALAGGHKTRKQALIYAFNQARPEHSETERLENIGDQIYAELQSLDQGFITISTVGRISLQNLFNYLNAATSRNKNADRHAHRYMALVQFSLLMARSKYWKEASKALAKKFNLPNPLLRILDEERAADPEVLSKLRMQHPVVASAMDASFAYHRAALASICTGEQVGWLGSHMREGIKLRNDDGGTPVIDDVIAPAIEFLAADGADVTRNRIKAPSLSPDQAHTIDGRFSVAFRNREDMPLAQEAYRLYLVAFQIAMQRDLHPLVSFHSMTDDELKRIKSSLTAAFRFHEASKVMRRLPAGDIDLVLLVANSLDPALGWDMLHALTSGDGGSYEVFGRTAKAPLEYAQPSQRWQQVIDPDKRGDYGGHLQAAHQQQAQDYSNQPRPLKSGWYGRWLGQRQGDRLNKFMDELTPYSGPRAASLGYRGLASVKPDQITAFMPVGDSIGVLSAFALIHEKYPYDKGFCQQAELAVKQLFTVTKQMFDSKSQATQTYGVELAISIVARLAELQHSVKLDSDLFSAYQRLIDIWNNIFVPWFVQTYVQHRMAERGGHGAQTAHETPQDGGLIAAIAYSQTGKTPSPVEAAKAAIGRAQEQTQSRAFVAGLLARMMRILPQSTLRLFLALIYNQADDIYDGTFDANIGTEQTAMVSVIGDVTWQINNSYLADTVANAAYQRPVTPAVTADYRRQETLSMLGTLVKRFNSASHTAVYESLMTFGASLAKTAILPSEDLSLTTLRQRKVAYPGFVQLMNATMILLPKELRKQWFEQQCAPQVLQGLLSDAEIITLMGAVNQPYLHKSAAAALSDHLAPLVDSTSVVKSKRKGKQEDDGIHAPFLTIVAQMQTLAAAIPRGGSNVAYNQLQPLIQELHRSMTSAYGRPNTVLVAGRSGQSDVRTAADEANALYDLANNIGGQPLASALADVIKTLSSLPSVQAMDSGMAKLDQEAIETALMILRAQIRIFTVQFEGIQAPQQARADLELAQTLFATAQERVSAKVVKQASDVVETTSGELSAVVGRKLATISVATSRLFGVNLATVDFDKMISTYFEGSVRI